MSIVVKILVRRTFTVTIPNFLALQAARTRAESPPSRSSGFPANWTRSPTCAVCSHDLETLVDISVSSLCSFLRVILDGAARQDDGTGCGQAISTSNFNVGVIFD
jgi:hypothetical protein